MSAVYELFSDDGTATSYKKVSARLPSFLEKYSPEKGYCLVGEVTDLLSLQKGKLQALHHQQSNTLDEDVRLIFTRKLLNSDGVVVATASALKVIREYKDYESGETAALQRLLALLGFGGECLDDDETNDFSDQQLKFREKSDDIRPSPTVSQEKTVEQSTEAKPEAPTPKTTRAKAASGTDTVIPLALNRQIAHQAKVKKVTTRPCATKEEAKAELKRLKAL